MKLLKFHNMVTLCGVVFSNDEQTNLANPKILSNPNHLLVYNENFEQYDDDDFSSGGGNAFLRKYRSDRNIPNPNRADNMEHIAHVIGIPTGSLIHHLHHLDPRPYLKVKKSLSNFDNYLAAHPEITHVFWSIDPNGNMGLGIFKGDKLSEKIVKIVTTHFHNKFADKCHISIRDDIANHGPNIYVNVQPTNVNAQPTDVNAQPTDVQTCETNPTSQTTDDKPQEADRTSDN